MLARQDGAGLERTLSGHGRDRRRALRVRFARRFPLLPVLRDSIEEPDGLAIEVAQRVRLSDQCRRIRAPRMGAMFGLTLTAHG